MILIFIGKLNRINVKLIKLKNIGSPDLSSFQEYIIQSLMENIRFFFNRFNDYPGLKMLYSS